MAKASGPRAPSSSRARKSQTASSSRAPSATRARRARSARRFGSSTSIAASSSRPRPTSARRSTSSTRSGSIRGASASSSTARLRSSRRSDATSCSSPSRWPRWWSARIAFAVMGLGVEQRGSSRAHGALVSRLDAPVEDLRGHRWRPRALAVAEEAHPHVRDHGGRDASRTARSRCGSSTAPSTCSSRACAVRAASEARLCHAARRRGSGPHRGGARSLLRARARCGRLRARGQGHADARRVARCARQAP